MSYVFAWLSVVAGMSAYRLIGRSKASTSEHLAGAYFSALALLLHWLLGRVQ